MVCLRVLFRSALLGSAMASAIFAASAQARSYTVLHNFAGTPNDGAIPLNDVTFGLDGDLYGATNLAGNGSTPFGTVFKLTPVGTLTTLHAFAGGADGGFPEGDTLYSEGKLYGTTAGGGSGSNYGVVYEVDAAGGTETVLHTFAGSDEANPEAGLTKNHGLLYGMASAGGSNSDGVVFSVKKK
jgi:uncharacterized repeat protein (TIGR03803 family)